MSEASAMRWTGFDALTLPAVRPVEACVALALAEHALAPARTALGAVPGQLGRHARHEGDLVGVAVVVVQREEPVARRQEVARSLGHGKLKNSRTSQLYSWHIDNARLVPSAKWDIGWPGQWANEVVSWPVSYAPKHLHWACISCTLFKFWLNALWDKLPSTISMCCLSLSILDSVQFPF